MLRVSFWKEGRGDRNVTADPQDFNIPSIRPPSALWKFENIVVVPIDTIVETFAAVKSGRNQGRG
jgi:hypothetical protein